MSKLAFSKRDDYSRCMNSAIYSLAMREHSRQEIHNKLKRKDFADKVDLVALLDTLEEKNYLSDQRFTESFIRYRITRGQGVIKITNELRQRGVDLLIINATIQEADIDWLPLANEQREKKFGLNIPVDFKEKAKQMRFLASRGFEPDIIRLVVS